jgi:hypothetical protein
MLTIQERRVVVATVLLFLFGLAVKTVRLAQPGEEIPLTTTPIVSDASPEN